MSTAPHPAHPPADSLAEREATVHPGAAWVAGLAAAGAVLLACCLGGGTLMVVLGLRQQAVILSEESAHFRTRNDAERAALALLEGVRDRLLVVHRSRRSFPAALPEAAPLDPWGTEIRYECSGPDRAWLSSAGPDRDFGTADDIGFDLAPE